MSPRYWSRLPSIEGMTRRLIRFLGRVPGGPRGYLGGSGLEEVWVTSGQRSDRGHQRRMRSWWEGDRQGPVPP